MEEKVITGLTTSDDVIMITINNVSYNPKNIALIFDKLAKLGVNVDMISQTAPNNGYVNISFTAPKSDIYTLDDAVNELKEEMNNIEVSKESDISKISVVGIGMMNQSGVAARVFNLFADNGIEFKQVTTSEISRSYTVNSDYKQKVVGLIAKEFNL